MFGKKNDNNPWLIFTHVRLSIFTINILFNEIGILVYLGMLFSLLHNIARQANMCVFIVR